MTISMGSGGRTLRRVLTANLIALIGLLSVLFAIAPDEVRSALIGAGVGIFGNGYAVWKVFIRPAKRPAHSELLVLYRAEFGKLVIVGVLCTAVFAGIDGIRIIGFLLGLLSGLIMTTVALATQKTELPVEEEIEN